MSRWGALDLLDVSGLPVQWRDRIAGHNEGVVPKLVRALEGKGFSVYAGHDLRIIADIQARNAERMTRLAEPFDPDLNPLAEPRDTIVVWLERYGVPVGCTALRRRYVEQDLAHAIEHGGLHDKPSQGSRLVCRAPTAFEAKACDIVWSGASFIQEGEEPIAFPAMFRTTCAIGFARWRWTWLGGICSWDLGRNPWAFGTLGMARVESGISRFEDGERTDYLLVAAHRHEFRERLFDPSYGDPTAKLGVPAVEGFH